MPRFPGILRVALVDPFPREQPWERDGNQISDDVGGEDRDEWESMGGLWILDAAGNRTEEQIAAWDDYERGRKAGSRGMCFGLFSLILLGLAGVLLMYIAHVWMDYVWLTATAYLARKGTSLVSSMGYRIIMTVFGGTLVYFGIQFILSSL